MALYNKAMHEHIERCSLCLKTDVTIQNVTTKNSYQDEGGRIQKVLN